MKRKILAALLASTLTVTAASSAFAIQISDKDELKMDIVSINTSIEPTYLVTIPDDVDVDFNAVQTDFGSIKLESARLELNKQVTVSITADSELSNLDNADVGIPFTVNSNGEAFTSASYTEAGEQTDLTIDIAQEDWDKAPGGSYTGFVMFTVSYTPAAG